MEHPKMTIHRALSELKIIDARIEKAITELDPVAGNQKGKKVMGYLTEEEFGENANKQWQSVNDLIDRKALIKAAIIKSNSETKVKVGSKEYTVANAITFKKIVETKNKLANHLKAKFTAVTAALNRGNDQIQKNADILLGNALGAEASKADKTTVDNIQMPYLEANTIHLIDPLKVQEKIMALEKENNDFQTEIDAVLSESNAITIITI